MTLEEAHTTKNIPQYLYHGTFRAYLDSIEEKGLIPNFHSNWDLDDGYEKSGYIYLSNDIDFCGSMVESSENEDIPDEYFDDIIVLEIDTKYLDLSKLKLDENYKSNSFDDTWSFQYKGIISPEAITDIIEY